MKASELRIGNWVEKDCGLQGCKAILATPNLINYLHNGKALYPQHVNPIALTEEWLVKFGFKDVNSDNRYVFLNQVVLHKTNGFLLSPFDTYRKLEYVHQLQNLYFALTGEELIIK